MAAARRMQTSESRATMTPGHRDEWARADRAGNFASAGTRLRAPKLVQVSITVASVYLQTPGWTPRAAFHDEVRRGRLALGRVGELRSRVAADHVRHAVVSFRHADNFQMRFSASRQAEGFLHRRHDRQQQLVQLEGHSTPITTRLFSQPSSASPSA